MPNLQGPVDEKGRQADRPERNHASRKLRPKVWPKCRGGGHREGAGADQIQMQVGAGGEAHP
eukprot:CAMPEP_0204086898 /NCGR_PEP_ID=MMETSP0360-20130528/183759_1 /ASSEMBLY_ACC=CAM_ASM_000342 /TAXON_ID=268821 /ORGANISM="Scrippsiella Hangoei, Strain SHTV-5" /LENGTH=61 /DNA_ID=CAMNT_0051036021 /DNA_START=37 /DNA_END=218 /DNA_ORIENTATION=-